MAVKNLKILLSGDSKPFVQSIEKSKGSMRGFKKESTAALDKIASQFGINTNAIRGNLTTFNGGLSALSGGFKGAAKSSGILSKGMKVLQVALISTGIGAILVALGIAIAAIITYFKSSQEGADKLSVAWAKMGAVMDVLRDRFITLGQGILMLFDKDTRAEGIEKLKNGFKGITAEMKTEAAQAGELEGRLQALEQKEIDLITVIGERKKKIDELRLAAEDNSKSLLEQKAALEKAKKLELQNLADETAIQRERVDIMQDAIDMGESTREDYKELADAKNRLNELESSSLKLQKRLQTEINSVTNQINSETEAVIKNAKAKEDAYLKEGGVDNSKINSISPLTGQVQGIQIMPPDVQPHMDAANQISTIYLDLANTVNQSMHMLASNFGAAIGEMIAGEADADVLGRVIVGALADMAIQVGQIAIGAGLAKMAIDQALVTFGGGVGAVAAGVALVALGSAVKSSMARAAANQGGGAGGGAIPSGSSGGRSTYEGQRASQELTITINGQFEQSGADLVAVLDKENVRLNTY